MKLKSNLYVLCLVFSLPSLAETAGETSISTETSTFLLSYKQKKRRISLWEDCR